MAPASSTQAPQAAATDGVARGGQQPIAGGKLYVYAAGTSGYGGASISLLKSAANTSLDASGNYYVTTDSNGGFNITGDYTCAAGSVVYLYLTGGSAGFGTNSSIGLTAILGTCPAAGTFAGTISFVVVDEITTVASAYAMAGFATDATHTSSSGTALAKTGIQNAFANAANLASLAYGQALTTTPGGTGTVPQATINTLGDILEACINSAGATSTACSNLLSNALSGGGGTAPDTATAAIYIAQNPASNVAALYAIVTGTPPFAPTLSSAPNDFTVAITYNGIGVNTPAGMAIDGGGNVWITNSGSNSVTKISSSGIPASGSPFTAGDLNVPQKIAIDGSGNAWITNTGNTGSNASVTELTSTGGPGQGADPIGDGGQSGFFVQPYGIAIDSSGNAWVANTGDNSVSMFHRNGAEVQATNYTDASLSNPYEIAIDTAGNVWITNQFGDSVTEYSSSGTPAPGSPYYDGGLYLPEGIAIDSGGNAWVANWGGSSVTELNSTGAANTNSPYGSGGLDTCNEIALDGAGNAWIANGDGGSITELTNAGAAAAGSPFTPDGINNPAGIAVDGAGDVWYVNQSGSVTELVGIATPVMTPIVAGVINKSMGSRP